MDEPTGRPDRLPVIATMGVHEPPDLARARRLLADASVGVGLPVERIDRLTVALSEVVTNAILHGNGSATITITGGDSAVTVEVQDHGTGLRGTPRPTRPEPGQIGGRGLWLAGELCDRVYINSSTSGTTVRMTMLL